MSTRINARWCPACRDYRPREHDHGADSLDRPSLFDTVPTEERFKGKTYDPDEDAYRLTTQAEVVFAFMGSGEWRTLREIAAATDYPEASISARLRDFRSMRFGGNTVERRRRGSGGTWEYRVTKP